MGFELYLTQNQIQSKIKILAKEINSYCHRTNIKNLTVISILNGSLFFTADLLRELDMDIELQTVHIKTYINNSNENTKITCRDLGRLDVTDKCVLILDDVYDTGQTIEWLREQVQNMGATEVLTCAFIDKIPGHPDTFNRLNFVGHVMTESKFLVGYGMDDNEHCRNMKDIVVKI